VPPGFVGHPRIAESTDSAARSRRWDVTSARACTPRVGKATRLDFPALAAHGARGRAAARGCQEPRYRGHRRRHVAEGLARLCVHWPMGHGCQRSHRMSARDAHGRLSSPISLPLLARSSIGFGHLERLPRSAGVCLRQGLCSDCPCRRASSAALISACLARVMR
jgi:hypothetical protein